MKEEIKYLEKQIEIHEAAILKLKGAIAVLSGVDLFTKVAAHAVKQVSDKKAGKKSEMTIRELILGALDDGIPKTKGEILSVVREHRGQDYKSKTLSPQISGLMGKEIMKRTFKGNPVETKFYYGKKEWFQGDVLKEEYENKIN